MLLLKSKEQKLAVFKTTDHDTPENEDGVDAVRFIINTAEQG